MKKEFVRLAIENGYTGINCEGWDWIRDNLSMLDYIFQSEDYKAENGMKYKCMPLIIGNDAFTDKGEKALSTAWYLNNEREHKKQKEEQRQKMLAEGWHELTREMVEKAFKEKKRLIVTATTQGAIFTSRITERIYKPFINRDGIAYLMDPKARSKGYHLQQFENAFCKII